MTFHAAKGLEFPVVYLVAMEDGILPHQRSLDHPDQLEEERRLVFVGITRGMHEVHASCARVRDYRGTRRIGAPSLFLAEMSGCETEVTGAEARGDDLRSAGGRVVDEYCQLEEAAQDRSGRHDSRTGQDRTSRDDGLVLESEEDAPPSVTRGAGTRTPPRGAPRLETAAELDRRSGLASRNTPTLASGERVRHAEYGEGTVAGVSGMGPRQVATVTFDGAAGVRRFIVSHGALERI